MSEIGALTLLTAGTWVSKDGGNSRYFTTGKRGDWGSEVIDLERGSDGLKLSVPLSEFGKSWHIVPDSLGFMANPTGEILGAFNA